MDELQYEDELCLDVSKRMRGGKVQIYSCHGLGGNQKWQYDESVNIEHTCNQAYLHVYVYMPSQYVEYYKIS